MEKRSHRRIRDLDVLAAFQGLVANEIGCARISMMAREQNTPFNGPNTDARDQLSPDRHIQLAPHGRSIQSIWRGGEGHRRRAGGHFCATMRTASLQLICSWCRRFRSDFSMVCCFCGMTRAWLGVWRKSNPRPKQIIHSRCSTSSMRSCRRACSRTRCGRGPDLHRSLFGSKARSNPSFCSVQTLRARRLDPFLVRHLETPAIDRRPPSL